MGCTAQVFIRENSYDIANNTSNVTIWCDYTQTGETWSGYQKNGVYGITVNGGGKTDYSFTTTLPKNSTIRGFEYTMTVAHKADGTGSVYVETALETGLSPGTVYAQGSLTLTTIPRATTPTLSASTVEMGKSITVNLPRASSSFTHNVTYSFGSASGTISSSAATSCTFTPPLTLANQIPNATSGQGTITVQTKNGSTVIGTKTINFTATVPASVVPSVSAVAVSDPTGNLAKYGAYVQKKSTASVSVTAEGSYSSSIKSYKVTANGSTYTSASFTTGVLNTSGTNTITATVTDSRGRTASKSVTISVLAYNNPVISAMSGIRCNLDGTANTEGAYAKITMSASITALNNKNSKTFKLEYKEATASSWTTLETYTSAYSLSATKIISCDTDKIYNFRLTAQDAFASTIYSIEVNTVYVLVDYYSSGKGIAFGKVATQNGFDCEMDAVFRKCTTKAGADLDTLNANVSSSYKRVAYNEDVTTSKPYSFTVPARYKSYVAFIGNYQNANIFYIRAEGNSAFIFKFTSSGSSGVTLGCSYSNGVLKFTNSSSASAIVSVMQLG